MSLSLDERQNLEVQENDCQCRIWKNGLDSIQCSRKKKVGEFCNGHIKKGASTGDWWLGIITEPRPEAPVGGVDNTPHNWKVNILSDIKNIKSDQNISLIKKEIKEPKKKKPKEPKKKKPKKPKKKEQKKKKQKKMIKRNQKNQIKMLKRNQRNQIKMLKRNQRKRNQRKRNQRNQIKM